MRIQPVQPTGLPLAALARLALLAAAFLVLLADAASGEIYRWTDSQGRPHFTDRPEEVPPELRRELGIDRPGAAPGGDAEEQGAFGLDLPLLEGLAGDELEPAPEGGGLSDSEAERRAREALDSLQGPAMAVAAFLVLAVLGVVVAFGAVALLLGCRLVGRESPGFKKAYGIVIVQFFACLVIEPGLIVAVGQPDPSDMGGVLRFQALSLVLFWLGHAAVLRGMLCEGIGQALVLSLVVNLVVFGLAVSMVLGVIFCAGGAALVG